MADNNCTACVCTADKASVSCKRVSGHPPACYLEAACFGHYCHYLALRMLSSITEINVTILSVVYPGNVQIVQDMLRYNNGIMNNDNRPPAWLSEL